MTADATVNATDGGTPTRSTGGRYQLVVANPSVYLNLVLVTPGPAAFVDGRCAETLAEVLELQLLVAEQGPRYPGFLTQLNFFAKNTTTGEMLPATEVLSALEQRAGELSTANPSCPLIVRRTAVANPDEVARATIYSDAMCSRQIGTAVGEIGSCMYAPSAGISMRLTCGSQNSVADGRFGIRAYRNGMCNVPGYGADTSVVVGADDGIPFDACVPLLGPDGPMAFIRARCETPTSSAQDGAATLIIAIVVPCFALWVLVFALVIKYKRRTAALSAARAMVLNQEDLAFGQPQPMRQDGGMFGGGEIDPETGDLKLYGGADEDFSTLERKRAEARGALGAWEGRTGMPSMWGGVRANPLYATPAGAPRADQAEMEAFFDGEDSLGDMEEFSDADFDTFADSLLAESEQDAFEDALFGAKLEVAPAASAWGGLRSGISSPGEPQAATPAVSTWGGMLASAIDDLDDLSDFENEDGVAPAEVTYSMHAANRISTVGLDAGVPQMVAAAGRTSKYLAPDYSSDEDERGQVVVAHTAYEDLGVQKRPRGGARVRFAE